MSSANTPEQGMNKLKELVQSIAMDRLKVLGRWDALQTEPLPDMTRVHGHWMAMALTAGPQLRVTFKVHFMADQGAKLAQKALGVEWDKIAFRNTSDFMREYCNMTLGLIKKVLQDHGFRSGISLPFLTRGFDEVFFPESSGVISSRSYWKVQFEEENVVCSAHIELFDSELDLSGLPNALEQQQDVGDVEFL